MSCYYVLHFPEGKMKAVTFSYDDGVDSDIRLCEIFKKNGLKATFNLNGALLTGLEGINARKLSENEAKELYADQLFEVACHAYTHPYLEKCDMILVMTVEPGFGGQSFMADQMGKMAQLKEWIEDINPDCLIEVDGGVDSKTHVVCKEAGANVLVAGSAYFKAEDRAEFVKLVQS